MSADQFGPERKKKVALVRKYERILHTHIVD